jgi:hypothetical protein
MLLMCGIQAWGQSQASTGQITGSVKDAAGAVVSGASVKVTNTATGFTQTLTTGDEGLYRAVLLPPGPYTVEISKEGFTSSKADVEVGVGRTTDVNASLAVGARKDEVTVTAEAIEASRHEAAAFVGATVIANIPLNGRRFQDIVNTTPAAQTDPSRGGISMTGQRMVNTGSIHVDGADYGQLFFGGIRGGERAQFAPTIPLDSIQEFQIVRSGYSAEFGRSTGGVITAITKSGTNALHGSAGYVIRPSSAGKSNEYYETTASQLKTSGCTTCVVNPNPTLHQWGGSVGGPVKKDKLFFFGSYDQQRQRIPHQVFFGNIATFTPTAATTEAYTYYKSLEVPFEQTNDAWLFLVKGDYLINDHHRLSVRYNHSNYEGVNANSVGTSLSPTVTAALSNNGTEIDKTRTVVGNLTSYFSTFANEFRVQYAKEIRPRVANAQAPTVSNGGVGNFGTTSFLGQNEEHDYRVELVNNLTRIKGAHTLKLGFEYNHIFATQLFGFNQHGSFGSASSDTTGWLTSLGTRWNDTNARYTHQLGNLQATMAGEQFAAFVQDAWKVRPNLTINYGLRWEGALNPSGVGSNAMYPLVKGFVFPDNHNEDPAKIPNQLKQFAPRLGFAWDPMGNGKTVIRGFGGIYFASTPLILYAASVNNFREPPGDLSVQLGNGGLKGSAGVTVPGCPGNLGGSLTACDTVYEMFQIVGIDLKTVPLDKLPDLTIDQVKQIAGTIAAANGSAFNPYSGASPYFTDNDYKNPRSYQAGFGIEREISKGWTAGVDASWIKTVNLQRDRDLNINRSVSTDIAGRPLYNTGARPISGLSAVVIRDSTAKGLYRSMTVKSSFKRKFGEVNAYYTLSENLDDDYQERNATGIQYMDQFNPASDYGFSDLDRKHQFVAQPVFFLPWSFEVSGAIRFVTGAPFTSTVGSDLNKDGTNNDRPYLAVGVPMERNAFRNRSFSNFDLRVQKNIKITESKHIRLSAEMFNLFNSMNLTYASRNLNYCSANGGTTLQSVTTCGISSFQNAAVNGWTLNSNFMQLRDTRTATAGQLLTNNNVGVPFEAQFSFKFVF